MIVQYKYSMIKLFSLDQTSSNVFSKFVPLLSKSVMKQAMCLKIFCFWDGSREERSVWATFVLVGDETSDRKKMSAKSSTLNLFALCQGVGPEIISRSIDIIAFVSRRETQYSFF